MRGTRAALQRFVRGHGAFRRPSPAASHASPSGPRAPELPTSQASPATATTHNDPIRRQAEAAVRRALARLPHKHDSSDVNNSLPPAAAAAAAASSSGPLSIHPSRNNDAPPPPNKYGQRNGHHHSSPFHPRATRGPFASQGDSAPKGSALPAASAAEAATRAVPAPLPSAPTTEALIAAQRTLLACAATAPDAALEMTPELFRNAPPSVLRADLQLRTLGCLARAGGSYLADWLKQLPTPHFRRLLEVLPPALGVAGRRLPPGAWAKLSDSTQHSMPVARGVQGMSVRAASSSMLGTERGVAFADDDDDLEASELAQQAEAIVAKNLPRRLSRSYWTRNEGGHGWERRPVMRPYGRPQQATTAGGAANARQRDPSSSGGDEDVGLARSLVWSDPTPAENDIRPLLSNGLILPVLTPSAKHGDSGLSDSGSNRGSFFSDGSQTGEGSRVTQSASRELDTLTAWLGHAAASIPLSALETTSREALERASSDTADWHQRSDLSGLALELQLSLGAAGSGDLIVALISAPAQALHHSLSQRLLREVADALAAHPALSIAQLRQGLISLHTLHGSCDFDSSTRWRFLLAISQRAQTDQVRLQVLPLLGLLLPTVKGYFSLHAQLCEASDALTPQAAATLYNLALQGLCDYIFHMARDHADALLAFLSGPQLPLFPDTARVVARTATTLRRPDLLPYLEGRLGSDHLTAAFIEVLRQPNLDAALACRVVAHAARSMPASATARIASEAILAQHDNGHILDLVCLLSPSHLHALTPAAFVRAVVAYARLPAQTTASARRAMRKNLTAEVRSEPDGGGGDISDEQPLMLVQSPDIVGDMLEDELTALIISSYNGSSGSGKRRLMTLAATLFETPPTTPGARRLLPLAEQALATISENLSTPPFAARAAMCWAGIVSQALRREFVARGSNDPPRDWASYFPYSNILGKTDAQRLRSLALGAAELLRLAAVGDSPLFVKYCLAVVRKMDGVVASWALQNALHKAVEMGAGVEAIERLLLALADESKQEDSLAPFLETFLPHVHARLGFDIARRVLDTMAEKGVPVPLRAKRLMIYSQAEAGNLNAALALVRSSGDLVVSHTVVAALYAAASQPAHLKLIWNSLKERGTSVDIRQPPVLRAVASKFIAFDEPGKAVALFENAAKRDVEATPELLAIWCSALVACEYPQHSPLALLKFAQTSGVHDASFLNQIVPLAKRFLSYRHRELLHSHAWPTWHDFDEGAQQVCGYVLNYAKTALSSIRLPEDANRRLFDDGMELFALTGDMALARSTLDGMRHWSISATEETHMNMVIGLAQANEIEQMLRSFDTLTTLTVTFSARVFEAAVAACGRAGRLEDAMRIYETMLDRGVAPTVQLKRILVEVCGLDKLSVMLSGTGEGA